MAARTVSDMLDKAHAAGADVSSIRKALVSGAALPPTLRGELEGAGIKTRQTYATADLGVIAYETDGVEGNLMPGMLVNDELTVEIVTPGTSDPARRQGRRSRRDPAFRRLSAAAPIRLGLPGCETLLGWTTRRAAISSQHWQ